MKDILRRSNSSLQQQIDTLDGLLAQAASTSPPELKSYLDWTVKECRRLRAEVTDILEDLELPVKEILPDLLSRTQDVTLMFNLFNERYVIPVLRAKASDRLSLKFVRWLHDTHPKTSRLPAGLSDGGFASWPTEHLPTIYFMPCSAQHTLLYLALFFHEFGHVLYVCHKPELDEIVRELQSDIATLLAPAVHRNGPHSDEEMRRRFAIVETWYSWAEEMFCDAVGFHMGGPAFARSFSSYLEMCGSDEFHAPEDELCLRDHPVTWLRVKLLAKRMRSAGYGLEASSLEREWQALADTMGIVEDHYGYFSAALEPILERAIEDMLTESSPRAFEQSEVSASEPHSPVQLVNEARRRYVDEPLKYLAWEREAITQFLEQGSLPQQLKPGAHQ